MKQLFGFVLFVLFACTFAQAAYTVIKPSPGLVPYQCGAGQNTRWIMSYGGLLRTTSKATTSWQMRSLPNNRIAIDVDTGSNDDTCTFDDFYDLRCLKAGTTTWVQLPLPSTTETPIKVSLYSYATGGIVITSYEGSAWQWVNGSWVKFSDSATNPMLQTTIAADGSIFGLTEAGDVYAYNTATSTWDTIPLSSGKDIYHIKAGATGADLVGISYSVGSPVYKRSGSTMNLLETSSKSWVCYGGGVISAVDSSDFYDWY
jgi:hypothetical protein